MVAVAHEVHPSDLVEGDRRQMHLLVVGQVHPGPASPQVLALGQEDAVEVQVAPFAAHDALDGHGAQAAIALGLGPQERLDLLQGEQLVLLVAQERQGPAEYRAQAGAVEILLGQAVEGHPAHLATSIKAWS